MATTSALRITRIGANGASTTKAVALPTSGYLKFSNNNDGFVSASAAEIVRDANIVIPKELPDATTNGYVLTIANAEENTLEWTALPNPLPPTNNYANGYVLKIQDKDTNTLSWLPDGASGVAVPFMLSGNNEAALRVMRESGSIVLNVDTEAERTTSSQLTVGGPGYMSSVDIFEVKNGANVSVFNVDSIYGRTSITSSDVAAFSVSNDSQKLFKVDAANRVVTGYETVSVESVTGEQPFYVTNLADHDIAGQGSPGALCIDVGGILTFIPQPANTTQTLAEFQTWLSSAITATVPSITVSYAFGLGGVDSGSNTWALQYSTAAVDTTIYLNSSATRSLGLAPYYGIGAAPNVWSRTSANVSYGVMYYMPSLPIVGLDRMSVTTNGLATDSGNRLIMNESTTSVNRRLILADGYVSTGPAYNIINDRVSFDITSSIGDDLFKVNLDETRIGNYLNANTGDITNLIVGTIRSGSGGSSYTLPSLDAITPGSALLSDGAGSLSWQYDIPGRAAGFSGLLAGVVTGTQSATTIANDSITNDMLATISTADKVSNSATTATDAAVGGAIVSRDAIGNFSATIITAELNGNAATAIALAISRNIAGQPFNGTANISIGLDDLSDVTSTSATDTQILMYDSGTSQWVNSMGGLPMGELWYEDLTAPYVISLSAGVATIIAPTSGVNVATLLSNNSEFASNKFSTPTTGRIKYLGPHTHFHCAVSMSMTGTANDVLIVSLYKDPAGGGSPAIVPGTQSYLDIATNGAYVSYAYHKILHLSTDDIIEVRIKNTNSNPVTIANYNLVLMGCCLAR